MATDSRIVDVSSFTTDAKFRTWGSAVSASIVAGGLTATADTGQINWTTVTKPIATSTKAGYEIYRFNDTLQSTYPVYIRIDYGSNLLASGNSPATWVTVGTGTNGAGTITGVNTGALSSYQFNGAASNTVAPIKSCTVAGFTFFLAGGSLLGSANGGTFAICRTCDSSGTLTSDGVLVSYSSGSAVWSTSGLNFKLGTVTASGFIPCAALSGSSVSTGAVVQLYKHYAVLGVPYYTYGGVTYVATDIASGTTFTAAPWSTTHTYLAVGATGYGTNATGGDSTNNTGLFPAFLWE